MSTGATVTHYDVLGVGRGADAETIRRSYRRLARKHHPDISQDPNAHENMARINAAFETLVDKVRREEYDAELDGVQGKSEEATPSSPVQIKLLRRMSGHKTPVYGVSFSPDSNQLVSVSFDNELIYWNLDGTVCGRTKLEGGSATEVQFTRIGAVVAGASETNASVWVDGNRPQNSIAWKSPVQEWVSGVAISENGELVGAGSVKNMLRVLDTKSGNPLYTLRNLESSVTCVGFSPDGQYVACGFADASVALREARSGRWIRDFTKVRSTVTAVAISSDNQFLAVAAVDLSIRVFDLETAKLVKMVYGHARPIERLAFHPNNWLFASASRDGTMGLWNAAKGIGSVRLEVSSRPMSGVAFSPNGKYLAAASQDKLVRLFEVTPLVGP